jgi:hypothetical protein
MSSSDRNLLFGILALQMDFISRDALIAAMGAWVLDKAKPLGQILVEQGHLKPQHLALLEPLVQAHIEAHNKGNGGNLVGVRDWREQQPARARVPEAQLACRNWVRTAPGRETSTVGTECKRTDGPTRVVPCGRSDGPTGCGIG